MRGGLGSIQQISPEKKDPPREPGGLTLYLDTGFSVQDDY
jgi:hypothetical protein